MDKNIKSKTGKAPVEKVGHTYSGKFGSEPMAKERGRSQTPSEQTFK